MRGGDNSLSGDDLHIADPHAESDDGGDARFRRWTQASRLDGFLSSHGVTSPRIETAFVTLTGAFSLLSLRLIFLMCLFYYLSDRWFVGLPFAVQLTFNALVAGYALCGSENRMKRRMIATAVLVLLDAIVNIVFCAILRTLLREFMLEPTGEVSIGWNSAYSGGTALIVFTCFVIIIEILLLVVSFLACIVTPRSKRDLGPPGTPRLRTVCGSPTLTRLATRGLIAWQTIKEYRRLVWAACVVFALCFLVSTTVATIQLSAYGRCGAPEDASSPECFSGCDPLDTTMCALPFPSSFYLREDPTTDTGLRVSFPLLSLPHMKDRRQVDPTPLNRLDGFSVSAPMLFYFPDVSLQGLVGWANINDSLNPDVSHTALINTATWALVPHWVELDMVDPTNQLLIMYPAVPLDHATRYVVGVRGLRTNAGQPVTRSPGFQDLAGPASSETPSPRRVHFMRNVFPMLSSLARPGGGRSDAFQQANLDLAWDFTTASVRSSLGDVQFMRDKALEMVAAQDGPDYAITKVVDTPCTGTTTIGRRIYGSLSAPSFLQGSLRGNAMERDALGRPVYTGVADYNFLVHIPCSLMNGGQTASAIMQYGHGLFGFRTESNGQYLGKQANDGKWVMIAGDWWGWAKNDVLRVLPILLANPSNFHQIIETSQQGYVNKAMLIALLRGRFSRDPLVTFGGVSVLANTPEAFYYGNSQGGVMGGGYAAMSRDFRRVILGVPGSPYALLLSRSHDFDTYYTVMRGNVFSARDARMLLGLMQIHWDSCESAGWLTLMNQQPELGIPAKQVLLIAALGDAQVTTLGAEYMARAYQASTVYPQTQPVFGVAERQAPFAGSALVEWRYLDVAPDPIINRPPSADTDTHECPRREQWALEQIQTFALTGVVTQTCDGVCQKPNHC